MLGARRALPQNSLLLRKEPQETWIREGHSCTHPDYDADDADHRHESDPHVVVVVQVAGHLEVDDAAAHGSRQQHGRQQVVAVLVPQRVPHQVHKERRGDLGSSDSGESGGMLGRVCC